ncbi:TRAFAC clade GTPase domain-containing protein [Streptomyces sp. L7]
MRDEVWEAFKGTTIEAPGRRAGDRSSTARRGLPSRGSRVACPVCGVFTPTRVCKECHSDLPSDYCAQESRIIALVGAAGGKSTCVTVLLHELRHRVGRAFGAAVSAMGGDTQIRDREMERDLYDLGLMPDPTTTAARALNDPLLYRLSLPDGRRGNGLTAHALVFFDAAGEDLRGIEAMNRYTGYLAAADGIILLVDPLQLTSVREELLPHGLAPTTATTPQQRIAADIATQLRSRGRRSAKEGPHPRRRGDQGRHASPDAVAPVAAARQLPGTRTAFCTTRTAWPSTTRCAPC